MKDYWYAGDNTRLTRWLYIIAGILLFGPAIISGLAETLHMVFLIWLNYFIQCVGFFCWGMASCIVARVQHRREPHIPIYTQPRLWFGLLGFALIPNGIILGLENSHVQAENIVLDAIIAVSVIAVLVCLILGVYFWWRKTRRITQSQTARKR
ncbi:hypothetical protein [Dictyobacter kobayashii]|uniref:Uncharacterized protein n=1 Tax=Dictyobacter kobayashii TaxID=2014872 RepID=A0A402ANL6_9CHLR|nr:hypothetical protein [Dictyobacter kobayashii]GCE20791.1 hypothetical protein KDK_45910 [Dictyobacter kobayashii]